MTDLSVQMTKDSRTLSLEMDVESPGGTPRGSTAVIAAPRSLRHSSEGALSLSERQGSWHDSVDEAAPSPSGWKSQVQTLMFWLI